MGTRMIQARAKQLQLVQCLKSRSTDFLVTVKERSMRIRLNRIAAVKHADVEIDGITVIAGVNDTGKSTVSKGLWCMFDSCYKYEQQFDLFRKDAIRDAARSFVPRLKKLPAYGSVVADLVADELSENLDTLRHDIEQFYDVVLPVGKMFSGFADTGEMGYDKKAFEPLYQEVKKILAFDDVKLMSGVVQTNFLSEFSRKFCNVDEPDKSASIALAIRGNDMVVEATNNMVTSVTSPLHLDVRAIYIDDESVLDGVAQSGFSRGHSRGLLDEDRHQRLRALLSKSQRDDGNVLSALMTNDVLTEVFDQIGQVMPGDLLRDNGELMYKPDGYTGSINASSMSAGMKIFGMLSLLLRNGSIERKSVVILDEPEIHLHPEWQIAFAEAIVLLQKAFDLHIMLTTHSPYFLRAVQVYAAKHSMATRCRYYQSEREGKWCVLRDVTSSTEEIFDSLVRPFERLEAEASRI